MGKTTFIMIGAAILDVLAKPVNLSAFRVDSIPAETLTTNTGGDAMNEARTLAALGAKVRLVSKLGEDAAGEMILGRCRDLGIDTEFIRRSAEIPTGVNIVLIDEAGERRFITNPHGTLRQFYPEDIPREALEGGKILCEHPLGAEMPGQVGDFSLLRQYRYGKIQVSLYGRKMEEE